MMKYAYDQEYLPLAQRVLGDTFDYAVNTLHYPLKEFYKMFLISGMAKQFEIANPTFVAGKNGCEIAKIVIRDCLGYEPEEEDVMYLEKSPEYWTGWALSYYQWKENLTYRSITNRVSIDEICMMYHPFHEADISKFVDAMNERGASAETSHLKRIRAYAQMSQRQLADASGVPIRQIQLFEQGERDINKTQAETLVKLAKALGCECTDLLEYRHLEK